MRNKSSIGRPLSSGKFRQGISEVQCLGADGVGLHGCQQNQSEPLAHLQMVFRFAPSGYLLLSSTPYRSS
jgi:hypothetical protein